MASVASQLAEEVTAHVQSDNLEDAREICVDVLTFRITYVIPMRKQNFGAPSGNVTDYEL